MAELTEIRLAARTMEIKHPKLGVPLGVRLTIRAVDDDKLERVRRAITNERIQLERKGKSFTAVDLEENSKRLAEAALDDWEWYDPNNGDDPATFNGEEPDFNPRNIRAVFAAMPWFLEQVKEEIGETKDFFTG